MSLQKQFESETGIKYPLADDYPYAILYENAKHLYYFQYSEWLESKLNKLKL